MCSSLLRSFALLGLLAVLAPGPARSGHKDVRAFDKSTWAQMQRDLPRPSTVVFSTTDCAYCPAVIEALARDLKKGPQKTNLVIVVMDGAGQLEALAADKHYRKGDALYVFEGQGAALRYSVNPAWRGLTPYVVMLGRSGEPAFAVGRPSKVEVARLHAKQ